MHVGFWTSYVTTLHISIILSSLMSVLEDECIPLSFAQRILQFIMTFLSFCPKRYGAQILSVCSLNTDPRKDVRILISEPVKISLI